jgi:hypothetical protein
VRCNTKKYRKELLELGQKDERGGRKHHLHRWFTEDIGHPELAKHIFAVNTLMRATTSWDRSCASRDEIPMHQSKRPIPHNTPPSSNVGIREIWLCRFMAGITGELDE